MSTSLVIWSILKLNSSETRKEVSHSLETWNIFYFSLLHFTLDGCICHREIWLSSLKACKTIIILREKLKFCFTKFPCGFNTDSQNRMFFINKQGIQFRHFTAMFHRQHYTEDWKRHLWKHLVNRSQTEFNC